LLEFELLIKASKKEIEKRLKQERLMICAASPPLTYWNGEIYLAEKAHFPG
jgi:hypothetical protein